MAMPGVSLNDEPHLPRFAEPSDVGNLYSRTLEAQSEIQRDAGDIIRDTIIGFADGLTVPFALTAGLSS
jgi:hypothetical protein